MRTAVPLLLLSSLVHASGAPTGASCVKSNECASKRCFEKYCRPDSDHPGGLGAICEANSHCVSKYCQGRKCGPPKESKVTPTSKPRGGREIVDTEEEKPSAPVEEPLPAATPCSEDLMATVYKEKAGVRASLFYARADCRYPPETIARAKELFAAGYGRNFSGTLRTVKEATPDQLACAKKAYDKKRDLKSPDHFNVPSLCLQPQEIIACAQDLAAAVFKGDESDGKRECERHAPAVISTAKAMFIEGYGDSFSNIAEIFETATPEQFACARRDYDFVTAGRTKYAGFSLRGPCVKEAAVMDCYFELMSTETKERQYDNRNRGDIVDLCASATPEDIALDKAVRALGFTQGIFYIGDSVRGAKPGQRECLKRLKPSKVTDEEKTDANFRMPKACSK